MTCAFDRDRIALHAGGDGPAGEAEIVEEHLAVCPDCRSRLEGYRQGMNLVAEHRTDARYPHAAMPARRGSRKAWRLAAAAVAALMALGTAGVYTESPAMAALLKSVGLIRVQELTPEEAKEFQARMQAASDSRPRDLAYDAEGKARDASGQVISWRTTQVTFEEAERAVDYHLLKPRYLPEGYGPYFASIYLNNPQSDVHFAYGRGGLMIHQTPPSDQPFMHIDVPEGATETVMVSGEPALLVRGSWGRGTDNQVKWYPGSPVTLSFTRGKQVIRIVAGQEGYPKDELIKIAESLE